MLEVEPISESNRQASDNAFIEVKDNTVEIYQQGAGNSRQPSLCSQYHKRLKELHSNVETFHEDSNEIQTVTATAVGLQH